MSGFGIRAAFDIGRKALRVQLAGLNVTDNSISNVNTPGYSRQEVNLATDVPFSIAGRSFRYRCPGRRCQRDSLIDRQLRNELHTKGRNTALERILNLRLKSRLMNLLNLGFGH